MGGQAAAYTAGLKVREALPWGDGQGRGKGGGVGEHHAGPALNEGVSVQ